MKKAGKAPAPFLSKTHQFVEDRRTDDVISWTEDGAAFVIWKPLELARDLLPNHFKHNNFSSFVRQLNTYGFRKVTSERWEYTNQHFRRGRPNLLSRIQRERNSSPGAALDPKSSAASPTSSRDQISSTANSSLSFHQSLLEPIHKENEELKKANEVLRLELAEVKQKNELLLGLLSNYMDDQATLSCNINNVEGEEEVEKGPILFGVCLR